MMDNFLHVYIESTKVGILTARESGDYFFTYESSWINSLASIPLSLSLPLQEESFTPEISKAFFSNLLPEGQIRDYFASKNRVSADDDFGLLAALGGDCAGALALYPGSAEFTFEPGSVRYRQLNNDDMCKLLDEAYIMDPTFLDDEENTRLSLAGVQDKLPIAIREGAIYLPLDGSPSTHILKPPNYRFPNLVENEAFCMTLAREMGLQVPDVSLLRVGEADFFYLIERYDRNVDREGHLSRIHQEDFCQATEHSYRFKYEEGGGPGYRACFQVIDYCRTPLIDRIKLIDLVIFNYLICNADSHAKNISLLYDRGSNPSLAPFYDLVCTGIYPSLSSRLAMAIGGVYDSRDIDTKAWTCFTEQAGVASLKPVMATLNRMALEISRKAEEIAIVMTKNYGENEVYSQLVETITNRAEIALRQVEKP
ncbi:MAG: type II toxin-antitoxin system HipA family toxin [Desulfuromusa sp.]|nr:type II toxin-antitoxin system HipA family toxin [Desulfuromusa sp.]